MLAGAPGFIGSPDSETLLIEGEPVVGDALHGSFSTGVDVGLLGIELATRRRNRVNGRVRGNDHNGGVFAVDQSFGNCPQYISEREWRLVPKKDSKPDSVREERLTPEFIARICAADTFFIATGQTILGIHHEDNHVGFVDGYLRLQPDLLDVVDRGHRQRGPALVMAWGGRRSDVQSTCVDDDEGRPAPILRTLLMPISLLNNSRLPRDTVLAFSPVLAAIFLSPP